MIKFMANAQETGIIRSLAEIGTFFVIDLFLLVIAPFLGMDN